MKKSIVFCALAALSVASATAQDRPTMGWSSWNTFGINISESIIKGQADAMMAKKLFDAGYNHINIDDGFFGGRNLETGELLIHPTRFPNGLQPIVDYIHNYGMKAGIYSDGGKNTCGNYHNGDAIAKDVGLYRFDQRDCDFFFKELGFDFIKVDFCGGVSYHNSEKLDLDAETRYKEIAQAIANTGRTDVRMNVCRWDYPGNWVQEVATSWRTTGDIYDSWNSVRDIIKQNLYLSAYCYGGHYNDMDMLEVGRSLTTEEDRTHFGMWCIMSSPLLIGCNMKTIKSSALELLKNPDLIALNQDPLCIQAYVVQHKNGTYVLTKDLGQLYGTTRAVALYNPSDKAVDMSIDFVDLDLDGTVKVRDLYEQQDLDDMTESLSVTVPAHGTRIYKLEAEKRLERNLYEGETAYLGKYQEIFNNQTYHSGIYTESSICSGGAVVEWIGADPNNDVQWRNVYSDEGGDYTMELTYISGESRNITISVNGEDVKTISCNSGSWSKTASQKVDIHLEAGENVVRLYNKNSSSWMPNVDCMKLQRKDADGRIAVAIDELPILTTVAQPDSDNNYYTLDGQLVDQPTKGIYIHQGKKVLVSY